MFNEKGSVIFTMNRSGSKAKGIFRNVIKGRSFFPIVVNFFPLRKPVVPSTLISRISSEAYGIEPTNLTSIEIAEKNAMTSTEL